MRFDGFYLENIYIVYVTDFVLTYSLLDTRHTIIDPHDKTNA